VVGLESKKNCVLIVDDDDDIRSALVETAAELGFEVVEASDGKRGIFECQGRVFDAIFSDINMPSMSGLEFLAAIRGRGIDTPVVFITGAGVGKENTLAAVRLGAFDFIEKPWSIETLKDTMSMASEFGMRQRRIAEISKIPEEERSTSLVKQLESDIKFIKLGPVVHNNKRSSA
jgi:DNA-binding NtrC family response regulator